MPFQSCIGNGDHVTSILFGKMKLFAATLSGALIGSSKETKSANLIFGKNSQKTFRKLLRKKDMVPALKSGIDVISKWKKLMMDEEGN